MEDARPAESPLQERELVLVRETHVPRSKLFAAWTDGRTYPHWYCPKPWYVSEVVLDPRPGGASEMWFNGPDGQRFLSRGVFLEVVPDELLVFTDAFLPGWEPNPAKMFVAVLRFETRPDGGTVYTARVRHWTREACERHAAMGFAEGWSAVFDQVVALVDAPPA